MADTSTKPADWTIIKIRPATREKYDRVKQVKRLRLVDIADLAVDSLLRADPEMRKSRRQTA